MTASPELLLRDRRPGPVAASAARSGPPESSGDPVLAFGRRSLPWLLAGLLLGLAVGAGVVATTPAVGHATTVVELTAVSPEVELGGDAPLRPISVDTDAQLVSSDEVVRAAATAAGRTPEQARDSLSVNAEQLTRILNITYTDRSPKAAQAGAERAAQVFLQARERLVLAPVRAALVRLGAVQDTSDPAAPPRPADAPAVDVTTPAGRQQAAIAAELALTGPGIVLQHALALPATDRGSISVPLGSAAGTCALLLFGVGLLRDVHRRRSTAGRPGSRRPGLGPVDSGPAPAASPAHSAATGRLGSAALDSPELGSPAPGSPAPGSPAPGSPAPGSATLGTPLLVRSIRRLFRPLVWALVVGAVGLGGGLAVATRVDARPTGNATVLLRPLPGNAFAELARDNSVDLQTEALAVPSDAVLTRAQPIAQGTVLGLRRRVTAKVVPGSEVLSVSVRGQDKGRSVTVARGVAQAVLDVRQERAVAAYNARGALLQQRITETQAALSAVQAPGADAALAPVYSERLVSLRDTLAALPPVSDVAPGGIIDTSTLSQSKTRLLRLGLPTGGAVAGVALGLLLSRRRRASAGRSGRRLAVSRRAARRWS